MNRLQENGIVVKLIKCLLVKKFLLMNFFSFYRMSTHVSLFRDNFALVGARNDNKPLIRDGPADYLFYLSGRRNCQYVHGRITVGF